MQQAIVIGAGLALGSLAFLMASEARPEDSAVDLESDPVSTFFEEAMSQVTNLTISVADVLYHPQVRAFLSLVRVGEGTTGDLGYRMLFGGRKFSSFADHPRQLVVLGQYRSTAAGAYQILERTWDEISKLYALADFSPVSQDMAAVGLIKRRGALADVLAGRFRAAIDKCNKEWASLPGSPYGQPTLSYTKAQSVLLASGAEILGAVA